MFFFNFQYPSCLEPVSNEAALINEVWSEPNRPETLMVTLATPLKSSTTLTDVSNICDCCRTSIRVGVIIKESKLGGVKSKSPGGRSGVGMEESMESGRSRRRRGGRQRRRVARGITVAVVGYGCDSWDLTLANHLFRRKSKTEKSWKFEVSISAGGLDAGIAFLSPPKS